MPKAAEIRTLYSSGDYSLFRVGKMFGVGETAVWRIVKNLTWVGAA
jgi:hypothetical protein